MIFFNWFCALIVAILLSTRYNGTKWFVFFCGLILLFLSYTQIGVILVLGVILAFIYSTIPIGKDWLQKKCVIGANRMKKIYLDSTGIKAKVNKVMKLLTNTKIDDENFSNTEDILTLIQELSGIDRDFLSPKQIIIIRKKTAELWKLYYRLSNETGNHGTHRNNTKDPYDVLGISHNATKEEIKRAYIKLCKMYHPDVNHSKEAIIKFKEIQEAYDILCSNKR